MNTTRPSWERLSVERPSESLQVCHLGERLALFLPAPHGPDRIPERQDRQHLQLVGDVEQCLHLVESAEAHPIRAHALRPGRKQHGLDGSARIGNSKPRLVDGNHDREWRLRDVRPARHQFSEPAERVPIANHDEVPWLTVHPAAGEAPRLDDPPHDSVWYRRVPVTPDGEQRANGLEDVIGLRISRRSLVMVVAVPR